MSDKKRFFKSVAFGLLCGILTCTALLGVFAAALTKAGLLPPDITDFCMAGCLAAGAFTAGFLAAKLNRGAGLIAGAAAGASMLAALTLTSALRGNADFSVLFIIKLAAAVCGGALGGILAVREKPHRI